MFHFKVNLLRPHMDEFPTQVRCFLYLQERNHTVSRASLKRMAKAADLLDLGFLGCSLSIATFPIPGTPKGC